MDPTSIRIPIAASCMLVFACACAAGPSVRPQLADSSGAVRAAEELGAQEVPAAALHLKYANEELERGRQLVESGEDEEAQRALERAELDAELSLALVREQRSLTALNRTHAELSELNAKLSQ